VHIGLDHPHLSHLFSYDAYALIAWANHSLILMYVEVWDLLDIDYHSLGVVSGIEGTHSRRGDGGTPG
jgi:hypothetical protein